MKKYFFTLFVAVLTLFACSGSTSNSDEGALAYIPADAQIVFFVDGNNELQKAAFSDLVQLESDRLKMLIENFDGDLEQFERLKTVYNGGWEFYFAMKNVDDYQPEVYVAWQMEEIDVMKEFLTMEFGEPKIENVWDVDGESVYIEGDVVFVSTEGLTEKFAANERFDDTAVRQRWSELGDDLFYGLYVDGSFEQADAEGVVSVNFPEDLSGFESAEPQYAVSWFDEAGLKTHSMVPYDGELDDMNFLEEGDEVVGKYISKENSFLYLEIPRSLQFFEGFVYGWNEGMGVDAEEIKEVFFADAGAMLGISSEQLKKILDNPFLFRMGFYEGVVPTVGLYWKLPKEEAIIARKAINNIDDLVVELISALNAELRAEDSDLDGIFALEYKDFGDVTIRKIVMDNSKVPNDVWVAAAFSFPGVDFSTFEYAFYYGLTEDDVFFVTFDPEFETIYGDFEANLLENDLVYAYGEVEDFIGLMQILMDYTMLGYMGEVPNPNEDPRLVLEYFFDIVRQFDSYEVRASDFGGVIDITSIVKFK